MSEQQYTMKQIDEAAERAIGCVSAVLGDDPKFVNTVRNVTHMLKKTLEDLPAPEGMRKFETGLSSIMGNIQDNLSIGDLSSLTRAQMLHKLQTIHALTQATVG